MLIISLNRLILMQKKKSKAKVKSSMFGSLRGKISGKDKIEDDC